ncbi:MAG: signal peptide peptidase SppA [Pseudomonadota bacterium]
MSETARRSLISRFFNGLWSIIVWGYRLVVIAMLCVSLTLLWLAWGSKGTAAIETNVALVIAPSGELVEQIDQDPAQQFAEQFNGEPPSQTELGDLIEALDLARDDNRIPLAVIKLDRLDGAGLAQLEELNAAIDRFRATGKTVHAYAPSYAQGAYYVAAHADDISVDPLGGVDLEGLSSYQNYFKDALDKLGVKVNVFRVGEYKSAVEPFLRNDMSEEAKAASSEWLGDLWTRYGSTTGAARELAPDAIDSYVRNLPEAMQQANGDAAQLALASKLVSHVETLADFRKRLSATVGEDEETGSFRQVWYGDYLASARLAQEGKKLVNSDEPRVALVVVQGEIVDGIGEPGQAGGDVIYDLLDEARRDAGVAAVVLRVNSPGGSVFASEQIRRAVQALRADGKPVVASMSSVAASGGYWISMAADHIIAHESTITGSIGIFGLIPTIDGPLEKLGIHTDGVGTTPLAGAFRIDRPLSPEVERIVQSSIEKGYRDFINGVAAGRGLKAEEVDRIARGRVWSGLKAKELGLIDSFGGLDAAVGKAAALAQLTEGQYRLDELRPEAPTPFKILAQLLGQGAIRMGLMGDMAGLFKELRQMRELRGLMGWMNDPNGSYARCFCAVELGGPRGMHR